MHLKRVYEDSEDSDGYRVHLVPNENIMQLYELLLEEARELERKTE